MKIKKSLAALTATVSIMALATGCSSSGSSGVVDTQADKGLAVMGDTITYDPNHLVNDGQPIELGYWSWGKTFRSLSLIAKAITGTHQSGPRFFGIGKNVSAASNREAIYG